MITVLPFEWTVRVYWEDTDAGGVVYYANYLKFLERARTEWLRALGFSQQALAVDPGILFMVVNLNVEYFRPARLDDALRVRCVPEREGRVTMRFRQQVLRDAPATAMPGGASPAGATAAGANPAGEILLDATLRVACLDARSLRPRRIPDFVPMPEAAPR